MSKDEACPLWQTVRQIHLFKLYNCASNTAVIRRGRHGRLGPISPETHSFHPARPFLRFMDHRRFSLSTLEICQTDAKSIFRCQNRDCKGKLKVKNDLIYYS